MWALAHLRGSNDVAIGYDEGSVIVKVHCSICTEYVVYYVTGRGLIICAKIDLNTTVVSVKTVKLSYMHHMLV